MDFRKLLLGLTALAVMTSPAMAAAQEVFCEPVKHCQHILKTHAADSFDYDILRAEFVRYGDKGRAALIDMATGKDEVQASRALDILSEGRFRFSPIEQRKLINAWPREDVETHAKVLRRFLSPLVREKMIDSLGHPNKDVRRFSRFILSEIAKKNFEHPLRETDFTALLRALLDEPSPSLIALLADSPPAKTAPIYTRVLRSGDNKSVQAAYAELYKANQETAFKFLVGVIKDLKPDDIQAALALSDMLRARHVKREDGFYMKFAKDLTEDDNLSVTGRLVGFDALIRTPGLKPEWKLSDTENNFNVFRSVLLSGENIDDAYVNRFPELIDKNPDPWIAVLKDYFQNKDRPNENRFVLNLGQFKTPLAKSLVTTALSDETDFTVVAAGVIAAAQQGQTQHRNTAQSLRNDHPFTFTRSAANKALHIYDGKDPSEIEAFSSMLASKYIKKLDKNFNKAEPYCPVTPYDFKSKAQQLPYFKPHFVGKVLSLRSRLTSIGILKDGWFAGFDHGEFGGGLVYYDNETGTGDVLLTMNTLAIASTKPKVLGVFPTEFWVVTGNTYPWSSSDIHYIRKTVGGYDMRHTAKLPSYPHAISIEKDGSLVFGFVPNGAKTDMTAYNPPLRLSPNGTISRACEKGASAPPRKATP